MGSLSDVVSSLFGLALNLMDAAINGFLGALGFDLDTFEHYFPAAADYHEVIVGFAVSLLFIMPVFQLFRNFGVVLDMEAEDPLKILGKTALFLGMIVYSRSVVNLLLQLMADPYAIFLDVAPAPYEFKLLTLATAMIGEGTDYANLAIKDELNAEEYGAAFRKGSDAADAVNAAFDELKADGTMQALADKYSLTLAD